jgi:hypothetical protein
MKKITLFLAIAMAGSSAFAQSQRLVLFEEFTQASCPPCATTNPGLNAMLDAHPSEVVSIKYQTDWPGSDVMNMHNPNEVQTRVSYYGVTGVPSGELDGGLGFSGQPIGMTYADVAGRYSQTSPLEIDVDFTLSPAQDSIYAYAIIRCTEGFTGGVNKAHMAVIERNIYFTNANPPGNNGEREFEGVMKKMLPSDQGTAVPTTWAIGDSVVLNYAWKLANVYDIRQLAVVVFVQNNTTKEVYQAGYMRPKIANNAGINGVSGINAVQCDPDVTPTVMLHNYANIPLTSVDINYYFDTNTPAVYNWTGSVAVDDEVAVTLPTLSPGTGSHVFHVATENPNASVDDDMNNDDDLANMTIYITNVTTPVAADFLAVAFPPAGFAIDNTLMAILIKWIRSSLRTQWRRKCKNEISSVPDDGTIDDLYAPKMDFSNSIIGCSVNI